MKNSVVFVTVLVILAISSANGFKGIHTLSKTNVLMKNRQFNSKHDVVCKNSDVASLDSTCLLPSKEPAIVAQAPRGNLAIFERFGSVIQLATMFTMWYTFNAAYNVYNSYIKKDFMFPYAAATMQLAVGALFYALPLWGLKFRKFPTLTKNDFLKILPIALLNAGGHLAAVIAMFEKGGGSFTHVIKASEPVVSVLLSFLLNGVVPKPFTALSLLPITYGVAYASTLGKLSLSSMKREFLTRAAGMAMASNVAFALRSILRKNLHNREFDQRTNLNSSNEHALTTLMSLMMLAPLAFLMESPAKWMETFKGFANPTQFWSFLGICGMSYYLSNEMQSSVLQSIGPVPTAVGNTLKRVVIFVALYLFTTGESFPLPKVIGSAISIAGCLGYAVCDSMKI